MPAAAAMGDSALPKGSEISPSRFREPPPPSRSDMPHSPTPIPNPKSPNRRSPRLAKAKIGCIDDESAVEEVGRANERAGAAPPPCAELAVAIEGANATPPPCAAPPPCDLTVDIEGAGAAPPPCAEVVIAIQGTGATPPPCDLAVAIQGAGAAPPPCDLAVAIQGGDLGMKECKGGAEGKGKGRSGKHQCPICKEWGHRWVTCKEADPDAKEAQRPRKKKRARHQWLLLVHVVVLLLPHQL